MDRVSQISPFVFQTASPILGVGSHVHLPSEMELTSSRSGDNKQSPTCRRVSVSFHHSGSQYRLGKWKFDSHL